MLLTVYLCDLLVCHFTPVFCLFHIIPMFRLFLSVMFCLFLTVHSYVLLKVSVYPWLLFVLLCFFLCSICFFNSVHSCGLFVSHCLFPTCNLSRLRVYTSFILVCNVNNLLICTLSQTEWLTNPNQQMLWCMNLSCFLDTVRYLFTGVIRPLYFNIQLQFNYYLKMQTFILPGKKAFWKHYGKRRECW